MNWFHMIAWVGNGGMGKTTGMARDTIRELDEGSQYRKAFWNIDFRHPKVEKVTFADLKDIKEPLVDGKPTALLCIDQIHKYLDSRQAMSPRNIYMSNIIIESRQHGIDVRCTTWGRRNIDPRARKYLNLEIACELRRNGFQYTMLDVDNENLKTLPVIPFDRMQKYWDRFDMNELVEDIDPRWDPRIQLEPPGMKA